MFIGVLFLAALSQSSMNFTDVFVGNWNVTVVELDEDGLERPGAAVFSVQIGGTGTIGKVAGQVYGEDEEGVPVPVGKVEFESDEGSNATFTFAMSDDPESDSTEPMATFTLEMGTDEVCVTTGKTNDGQIYSLNVLSMYVVELTLYNKETKAVTIVRCLKEQPVHQQSIWTMLLPMLPSLMMMFMNMGRGGCPACGPCNAGENAAAGDKKND